ncbi:MAG TPA: AAA family ATPase [Caulobacteraceae bacterium]|nr:AAA family ATPase [Caulobacteraceae bacterium]
MHDVDLRAQPFASPLDHLMAELERLDLMIRHFAAVARDLQPEDDPYRGLYISSAEFAGMIETPAGLPRWAVATPRPRLDAALSRLGAEIEARAELAEALGSRLRLSELQRLFALNQRDVDLLLICVAPELDVRYERVFAYLQDDVTRRRPSVDLALNLLCASFPEKLAARASLGPDGPLRRNGLIDVFDDPQQPRPTLLGQCLKLEPRILDFLLGGDEIDARLAPFVSRLQFEPDTNADFALLDRACELQRGGPLLHLHGPRGVGKTRLAAGVCARSGLAVLKVEVDAMLAAERERFDALTRLVVREGKLQRAALCWNGVDALFAPESRRGASVFVETLRAAGAPSILTGLLEWDRAIDAGPNFVSLGLAAPDAAERADIWRTALGDEAALQCEIPALASRFRFTAGDIAAVLRDAKAAARAREPTACAVTAADLYACCRERSAPRLGELARKLRTEQRWSDLVLPDDSMRELHEICNRVKHRAEVMEQWGFEAKLSLGKGLSALFAGPSGAGKTMAAGIMAAELGLDLYRVDLSSVVSKYIGETEKNLARVFAEAEQSSAILFFDEADALFGKRSEVRDAHDRHANVEVSYLLQRMEDYEGVSILATNLRRNMDDAFTRRLAFIVHFPAPEAPDRLRIWQRVFPEATPLAGDLDLAFMARQFKLAGGNIRNIAIAAAFLAASEARAPEHGVVTMSHLIRATRRELQKLGKVAGASEFAEYAHLREEDAHAAR